MGFFSFLKYTFIIFAAHLATSCGAPFENHCCKLYPENSWWPGSKSRNTSLIHFLLANVVISGSILIFIGFLEGKSKYLRHTLQSNKKNSHE
jgi:hypothetical protein